jgi:hypothetical protein
MAQQRSTSEKIRMAAADLGYVAPLVPSTVPTDVRERLAEEHGVSRQAVDDALSKELGVRRGRKSLATRGQAPQSLQTARVAEWLRAYGRTKAGPAARALTAAADAIERGAVGTWSHPDTGESLDP